MRNILRLRKVYLLILDVALVNFAVYAGLYLRFDGNVAPRYLDMYLRMASCSHRYISRRVRPPPDCTHGCSGTRYR